MAREWFLRTGEHIMLPGFSRIEVTKVNIWHRKKVNFRISYLVFSSRRRVTRSGKFDCVSSFCDPFKNSS